MLKVFCVVEAQKNSKKDIVKHSKIGNMYEFLIFQTLIQ